ncbi:hypothetical protein IJ090_00440 [Candidatus Saccharibacteria bacterium]|nr:hypothetical protein [Candidatus Saccharibacteria bacterium]
MQKTATKARASSSYTRPTLQKSRTLSRKYVRRPVARKVNDVSKPTAAKAKVAKPVAVKVSSTASSTVAKAKPAENKIIKRTTKIAINADKTPKVAFKTRAKAEALSSAIASSAKKTPIKAAPVARVAAIRRFNEPKTVSKVESKVVVSKVEPKTAVSKVEPKAEKKVSAVRRVVEPASVRKVATPAKKTVEKKVVSAKARKATPVVRKQTAAERKAAASDAAREAMRGVATMNAGKPMKSSRGKRFAIAFGCSAIVVAALGIFVAINMPNISVKIAAAQTGIEATYPSVVPRNYSLETVASDKSGKITMKFVGPEEASFILTEEKSTWDSTAVLNNYVKTTYSASYSTMHEQGITYYSEPGSAVWVNGGILYKIASYGKNLSREQIRNLVVSL